MLQLKNVSSKVKEKMESDFYIPIKVRFEEKINPPIYWRTGDFEYSLIELGLDRESGAIVKATLVLAKNVFIAKKQETFNKVDEKLGLPLFKTDQWGKDIGHLDEKRDFDVYVDEDSATIVLAPHKILLKVINGRVVFGFNGSGFLCSIEVRDIKAEEMSLLKESLKLTK